MRNLYTIIKYVKCEDGKLRRWSVRTSNFKRKVEVEEEKIGIGKR